MNNKGLWFFGIILSLGLVVSVAVGAYSFYSAKKLDNVISVTGSAQKTITSDVIKWKASFSRNIGTEDVAAGYKQIHNDEVIVQKFLKDNNVSNTELVMNPAMLQPVYNYSKDGQSLVGYNIVERLEVQSGDISKIEALEKSAPETLSSAGVIFSNDAEEFYYTKLNDLKVQMLADATSNAKQRAEQIAKSTGSQVGSLKAADMGVFQVTAVNSTDVSDYGTYDTSVKEKQVTAVVRAGFYVK